MMAKQKQPTKVSKGANGGELLDMAGAIAMLKTTRPTFYRWLRAGKIKGMKVGRQWRFYREDVERFLRGQAPKIALRADVGPLLAQLRERYEQAAGKPCAVTAENGVAEAVALTVELAVRLNASDIHIEAHSRRQAEAGATEAGVAAGVRLRIDGVLHEVAEFDRRLLAPVVEQWKILGRCDPHETSAPQDARILYPLSDPAASEREIDLRVCFLPAFLGEALTARILYRGALEFALEQFDYAPINYERLTRAIESPWGLIAITGPTGSGKTTTLYAAMNHVNHSAVKAMSVEDPVEYVLPGVVQVGVDARKGVTFPRAMRSLLRSDPDVIMVGEIRDLETLTVCCQSALTGHLVLTQLHTASAAGALRRMLDLGLPGFMAADAAKLVSAQRLVRALCPECRKQARPARGLLQRARALAEKGGLNWGKLRKSFHRAAGCPACAQTGYRRRKMVAEMLPLSDKLQAALRREEPLEKLAARAVAEGMLTLGADGVRRAALGETSLDEVLRVMSLH